MKRRFEVWRGNWKDSGDEDNGKCTENHRFVASQKLEVIFGCGIQIIYFKSRYFNQTWIVQKSWFVCCLEMTKAGNVARSLFNSIFTIRC